MSQGLIHRLAGPRRGLIFLLVCCGLFAFAPSALANTYHPTRTGDPTPNGCHPHNCSLREAIIKANSHPGHDTIVLKGGKTYKLTIPNVGGDEELSKTGDLDVTGSLRIKSSNHQRANVKQRASDGVFEIGPVSAVNATFKRIRVRGGHNPNDAGGGIRARNGGTLKLVRSAVVSNKTVNDDGGGISVGTSIGTGKLIVVRSLIAGNTAGGGDNAGAIEADNGPVVTSISRSKIVNNHSGFAGGIYFSNGAHATINQSTFSGNVATGDSGGAIFTYDPLVIKNSTVSGNSTANNGGGLGVGAGTINLTNDTFANNKAKGNGGGIFNDGATVNMNAVTVARNRSDSDNVSGGVGGGLFFNVNTFNVKNSLVARNSAGVNTGPDCYNSGTAFNSGGHNLIGNTNGCTSFGGNGDRLNQSNAHIGIGSLASHGGPTRTIALLSGSKAINHGGSSTPRRDQRGVKRDSHPDIGAFEKKT